jgi:hypothetical protein
MLMLQVSFKETGGAWGALWAPLGLGGESPPGEPCARTVDVFTTLKRCRYRHRGEVEAFMVAHSPVVGGGPHYCLAQCMDW